MSPASLPLNALRAFEASARHLNFTRAAEELCVTQGAVSHQVRALEFRLGVSLFRRLPRGLALTDEAMALLPGLSQSFARIGALLDDIHGGVRRAPLTVGVGNTFAVGWLIPRLEDFRAQHPLIDVRVRTHNNKVDLTAERLDCGVQFGEGAWPGLACHRLMDGELTPLAAPRVAAELRHPADLRRFELLRSYRADEWSRWFAGVEVEAPPVRGAVFDSSIAMVAAAERGFGVALAPPSMFRAELEARRLAQPFATTVAVGAYYLTRLAGRPLTKATAAFWSWCADQAARA